MEESETRDAGRFRGSLHYFRRLWKILRKVCVGGHPVLSHSPILSAFVFLKVKPSCPMNKER
jgi:hypothetical protein